MRKELAGLGVVVHDTGKRQWWRRVQQVEAE
ncbi:CysS/YqeB C-terminal domain-containing protein [Streptomyces sp. NBC_01591]